MQSSPVSSLRWPRLLLVVLLLMAHCSIAVQIPAAHAANSIWYVKHDADAGGDGRSWASAFKDLQAALAEAEATDQIWVASGVYYPTTSSTLRTASFVLKNGVALYGGFVGNESQLSQRDWVLNKTILSGDIDRNDTHTNGIVSNTAGITGNNSYHVVTATNLDASTIIDGFVITAGRANAPSPNNSGGAIYNSDASPTIMNVSFTGNSASGGGAIYNRDSSPTITNASFSGNYANGGGAIYNRDSSPTIANASFTGNRAEGSGGAINNNYSSPTITNASFTGNSAGSGGAIYNDNSSPTITNASFTGNSATINGGAIHIWDNSSPTITNVSFTGNSAGSGGAISNDNSSPTITNASFTGNSAGSGGAIFNDSFTTFPLSNSIVWGNSSSIGGNIVPMTISYSLIEGCNPGGIWYNACGANGGGNLADTDPLFVNPISYTSAPTTTGDLRLLVNSPAIDTGNNADNSTTEDLDGKPRIVGSKIDLGAYEHGQERYSLVSTLQGKGSITQSPDLLRQQPRSSVTFTTSTLGWHMPNSTVTLTATANPGWSFAGWSGDLSGTSSPTTLLINNSKVITATFSNDPPTADAGSDQTVVAGSLVTLNGNGSSDEDPSQTLAYMWAQTGGVPVTLSGVNSAQPTFTAPNTAGVLSFSLVVTDSMGLASAADSVKVTVTNGEPVANAGEDQTVVAGSMVTLDGSGSSDPDGHTPLSYAWKQTAGPSVTLTGAMSAKPSFSAPNSDATLSFELIVTDSMGLVSVADTVTITVEKTIYTVYLPQVLGQDLRPNLVITELKADQNGVRVVISNTGDAANQAGFWVDLYVNPSQVPTANTVWQKIAPAGAAWLIKQTLEPGQSITLTQSSPFYVPEYSFGRFAAGDQLYAYIDSYHSQNSYGVELESDESDNRYGPVTASGAGNFSQPGTPQGGPSSLVAR